ncbi:MAG: hypothetical protein GF364_13285 [Candidatus Lokiarchaeota archaeon]|nr:hypothetical protein [Candidatus Lokiarchaeota archaeon]
MLIFNVISFIFTIKDKREWKKHVLLHLIAWSMQMIAVLALVITIISEFGGFQSMISDDGYVGVFGFFNMIFSIIGAAIVFVILVFISGIIIIIAWNALDRGFVEYQDLFSMDMFYNIKKGVKLMKVGGLLMIFIILWPLGIFLQAIGLIKMGIQFKKFKEGINIPHKPHVSPVILKKQYNVTKIAQSPKESDQAAPSMDNDSFKQETKTDVKSLKKQILGYLRINKMIDVEEAARIFHVSEDEIKKGIYELAGDNAIDGEFQAENIFVLK